jgi:hypothetical protein
MVGRRGLAAPIHTAGTFVPKGPFLGGYGAAGRIALPYRYYPTDKLISFGFVPFVVPSSESGLNRARTFPLNLKLGKSGRIAAT